MVTKKAKEANITKLENSSGLFFCLDFFFFEGEWRLSLGRDLVGDAGNVFFLFSYFFDIYALQIVRGEF